MDEQQFAREKALYLYISGLERGDFDQMSAILEQAQFDPALEAMIDEAHEEYAEELKMPEPTEEERAYVKATLARLTGGNNG